MPDVKTSDTELIRMAAEKVMGWRAESEYFWDWNDAEGRMVREYWNPLTSDADCWMLVDKKIKDGYEITLDNLTEQDGQWSAVFWLSGEVAGDAHDPDRRASIVLACLRAVGAFEDQSPE